MLHRVMKTNYFTLFVSALFQLHSIYGSTTHHNYARWMILCALELWNSKSENPHIAEMHRNGGFTINRTGNPFKNAGVTANNKRTGKEIG